MAPGARSKFVAPMFEPEVFRKQIYCIEESTCGIFGTSWYPPIVIRRPGNCAPVPTLVTCLNRSCWSLKPGKCWSLANVISTITRIFPRAENDTTHRVFWTNQPKIYSIISSAAFQQQKWKCRHSQSCSDKMRGSENDGKFKLERLVCTVGANLQTTIHVISCLRIENGWKLKKRTCDFLQTHTLQKITRLHRIITRSLGQSKNH